MITEAELVAIQARCDAATPGPWRQGSVEKYHVYCVGTGFAVPDERVLLRMNTNFEHIADADFIAHAREDVPKLLTEVRRLSGGCLAAGEAVVAIVAERDNYKRRFAIADEGVETYAKANDVLLGEIRQLKRDAGRLADEVAVLVRRKVIDSRSPAADALLDFRDPPSTPRADALAEARAEIERYVYDGARTCTKCEGSGTYSNGALGLVRCKYCDGGSIALYRKRITP